MTSRCVINVAVDLPTKTLLAKLATLQNTTTSEIIRRAIAGYLCELQAQLERQKVDEVARRLEAYAGVRVQPYNLRPGHVPVGRQMT